MPVQAHEIGIQVRQGEIRLAPAMRRIDDDIDAARPRHRDDLPHRQHQPGAMADMGVRRAKAALSSG